ncbi:MAG TPA: hypothetical protein VGC39_06020 [Candidatus Methylacidiphilales bacterium]
MKVISQMLGYSFRILAVFLGCYLALMALDLVHHRYGIWGYIVGILILPITVPAALVYQGFVFGIWINLLGLLILMPLLWKVGSILIRRGRTS